MEELQTCHSEAYTLMYGTSPEKFSPKLFEVLSPRFCKLACTGIGVDADTVWNNDWTPTSTRIVCCHRLLSIIFNTFSLTCTQNMIILVINV